MACGCPSGYTPSGDGLNCIKITTTPATVTPVIFAANSITKKSIYAQGGTNFYDIASRVPPFIAVTGPDRFVDASNNTLLTVATISNALWGSGIGFPFDGRLNSAGVEFTANNEWIGFTHCIDVPVTQGYLVSIGAEKEFRIKVNGVIYAQASTIGFPFTNWHVIPVILNKGINIIEMETRSNNPPGSFGVEIYQGVTAVQVAAYTTQAQLTAVTIFSTLNKVGQLFDTGENSGYICPSGYALDTCTPGVYSCSLIQRAVSTPCCFTLTECKTGATIKTNTDLTIYLGKVIGLYAQPGCWTVTTNADVECIGGVSVVVSTSYVNCATCAPTCFLLSACAGGDDPIITDTDLTNYIGKVVKIKGCPDTCWIISQTTNCSGTKQNVILDKSYTDCNLCNPPVVVPSPELIRSRKIKPGFNTEGCSPEYTLKINCKFADQVFNIIKKKRYGITVGCDDEFQKYSIKKDLLDLREIYDPLACVNPIVVCCDPCSVEAILLVIQTISCPAPTTVTSVLQYPISCGAPVGSVTTEIVINNPLSQP